MLTLSVTSLLAIATGMFFLLGRGRSVDVVERAYYGDAEVDGRDHLVLVYGVLGAVMVGWLVLVWFTIGRLRAGERTARRELAWSFGAWFVLDTTHSSIVGVFGNVVLNAVFAIGIAAGLWLTRPAPAAGRPPNSVDVDDGSLTSTSQARNRPSTKSTSDGRAP